MVFASEALPAWLKTVKTHDSYHDMIMSCADGEFTPMRKKTKKNLLRVLSHLDLAILYDLQIRIFLFSSDVRFQKLFMKCIAETKYDIERRTRNHKKVDGNKI